MTSGSTDDELEQARQEIRAAAAGLAARPPLAQVAVADNGIERTRLAYALPELTDPAYLAFVEGAFHALLKRRPTPAEAATQLGRLGAGAAKVEILGDLCWSAEGRHIGAHVSGLRLRYLLAKAARVPVLGHLLGLGTAVATLPLLPRQLRAIGTLAAAGRHEAQAGVAALDTDLGALRRQAGLVEAALHAQVAQLTARDAELAAQGETLTDAVRAIEQALRARIEALEATPLGQQQHWASELDALRQRTYVVGEWFTRLERTLGELDALASRRSAADAPRAAQAAAAMLQHDGARLTRNAGWATQFGATLPPGGRVLALASGADWLDLLALRGLDASGADLMPAIETLHRCADGSLDGLSVLALPTLAQGTPLLHLLGEAARALRPGGSLLLADAPEAAQVVATLTGAVPAPIDFTLVEHALAASGFHAATRIDSTDGRPALLARVAS